MEEEQKVIDLFEKDIKEELEPEEIKEEPLDDECFKRRSARLSHNFNFISNNFNDFGEEVKMEEIDDELMDIKEENLEEYQMQHSVQRYFIEKRNFKPKFVINPKEIPSECSRFDVTESSTKSYESIDFDEIEKAAKEKASRKRQVHKKRALECHICCQPQNPKSAKSVSALNDRMILLTGSTLSGKYKFPDAQILMVQMDKMTVCHFHFPESVNQIFRSLNIKSFANLTSAPHHSTQELMITVNSFLPSFQFWQFFNALHAFADKNKHLTGMDTTGIKQLTGHDKKLQVVLPGMITSTGLKMFKKTRKTNFRKPPSSKRTKCQLCFQLQDINITKLLYTPNDKLVMVVGCILQIKLNFRGASQFMKITEEILICQRHFTDAIEEIYTFLNIKHHEEMTKCAPYLAERFMLTVRSFALNITLDQFSTIFSQFCNSHS